MNFVLAKIFGEPPDPDRVDVRRLFHNLCVPVENGSAPEQYAMVEEASTPNRHIRIHLTPAPWLW